MKSRPFMVMGIVFGLPAFVYLFFYTQSLFNANLFHSLSSLVWLIYLIFLVGAIILYINIDSDIQEYRFNNQKIFQLILSPVSHRKIIFFIVSAVVIESFILSVFSGVILYLISGIEIPFKLVMYLVPSLLIFLFILGALFVTISLITEDYFIYNFLSVCVFLVCIIVPGIGIVDFSISSTMNIWQFIPTTAIINFVLFILLADIKRWSLLLIPGLVMLMLLIINGQLLRRRIRR